MKFVNAELGRSETSRRVQMTGIQGSLGQSIESFPEARASTSISSEYAAEGRASWLLGGKASAEAGPKFSESDAEVYKDFSSLEEIV